MSQSRIQMGHPAGQTPPHKFEDFDWIRQHEKELLEQYGECSIIVYKGQVIGSGTTYAEAVADAEQNLSSDSDVVMPVHHRLREMHSLIRFRRVEKTVES